MEMKDWSKIAGEIKQLRVSIDKMTAAMNRMADASQGTDKVLSEIDLSQNQFVTLADLQAGITCHRDYGHLGWIHKAKEDHRVDAFRKQVCHAVFCKYAEVDDADLPTF